MKILLNISPKNLFFFTVLINCMIISLFITNKAYGSTNDRKILNSEANEKVEMIINVNESNTLSGVITISFITPPKGVESSYIILPFIITNLRTSTQDIQAAYNISDGYAILHMIIAPTILNGSTLQFDITPQISSQAGDSDSSYWDRNDNILLIQMRNGGPDTLLIVYNIQGSDQNLSKGHFKGLSNLVKAMVIPSKITVVFPPGTNFNTSLPPYSASNVSDFNSPKKILGFQQQDEFISYMELYQGHHLWINYDLPISIPIAEFIYWFAIGLCSLLIPIISIPNDVIDLNIRFILDVILMLIIPGIVLFDCLWQGTSFLIKNYETFIPLGIIPYLGMIIISSVYFTRQFSKRRKENQAKAASNQDQTKMSAASNQDQTKMSAASNQDQTKNKPDS